ncbi:ABC transporter permease [Glaciecola siphonariae]|uniref:ABC transporter permease n=1 Tax=Glaciecola siphonariae TaxID=521012 RepID=A0ABV9LU68_9ALTE
MRAFLQAYVASIMAVLRDRNILLLVMVGPIVYSIYYPFPYSAEQVREIPVAVVDLDNSSASRELIRLADASPEIKVMQVLSDPYALKQAMWSNDVEGGLIIPHGFRRNILRNESSTVIALGNGAYFLFNRGDLFGFAGAAQTLSAKLEIKHERINSFSGIEAKQRSNPLHLELRAASNPGGGYSTYVVPAVAIAVLQQTLLLGVSMLLATWRQTSAPFDMNVPTNRLALMLAAASFCMVNTLYYLGIVYWREDYPHMGQLGDLLVLVFVFSLTLAAWSLVIASWFRYREQAIIHLIPTSIPTIFVAGFAWPIEAIPQPIVALSALLPSTAAIQAFLNVDQMGASLTQVMPEVLSLLVLLSAAIAYIVFKPKWLVVPSHRNK